MCTRFEEGEEVVKALSLDGRWALSKTPRTDYPQVLPLKGFF